MDDNQQKLEDQLTRHEDRQPVLYLDTATPPQVTGGIGHNFTANPVPGIPAQVGFVLTDRQIDDLFVVDVRAARAALLKRLPWMETMDGVRFCVLVNMTFNMGITKLATFRKTLAHAFAGEWSEASTEMLNSKWANQVGDYAPDSPKGVKNGRPGRAWELARQMRTGTWWEA